LQAPGGVAVDGAGNTYIADYTGNAVYKETPLGTTYTQSTVASSLNAPTGVAVDANGNVYIVNSGSQQVFKETLSNGSYTQSSIGTGLVAPYGVAVDSSGSVYISDPGNTTVFKETFSAGSYTQSSIGSGLEEPEGLAMDAFGNIYISDAGLVEVLKETLSAGSYTQSVVSASGLTAPAGLAVDGSGNIYIADYLGNHVLKEDLADPPSLSFATKTKAGTTDTADGPLTVTVTNVGNAPLTFPTPSSGNNPSISGDFTFDSSGDGACPLVAAGSADGTLAAGATCFLSVSFTPTAIGALTGSLMLTDNAPNAAAPSYATQTIPLSGMGIQGPQTITFPAITAAQYALTQLALSAAATSGLTVTFTSTTPAICTVSGSMASLLTVGTCILHAAQAGNPSYTAAATVSQGFYVHPAQQTITFKTITGAWYALSQITLSATASSGLAVSFATTTPTVCSVVGNTVSLLIGGSCILQATQTGNTLYGAATPVTQVVAVHLAHQSITFTPITGTQYALSQLALSASSSSGLPVTLASATPTVCTLSGNTASLLIAGTCDVHATQAGNATYAAAPLLAYDIDVHPIIQTINFATVAVPVYPLTQVTLSATANSGLSVSFASVTPTICTVSGTTLSLLTAGNCYLHALQNGNPDYAAAPIVTQKVVVTPLSQTITFPTIGSQIVGANVTLSATANSGLTVSFASATTSVCSVSGTTATMLTAGSCVIHATQAGNSTYSAAPLVSQSFAVKAAS
jgi:streptogramin lyase